MAEFIYNNIHNTSTNHMLFELNCNYYPRMFFKKNTDSYFHLKIAKKLIIKL